MVGVLTDFQKIDVLLHEYDGLRSEIVQRWLGTQQQIGVACLVLMGVLTVLFTVKIKHPQAYILYGLLGAAFVIFVLAMYQVGRDTYKAATRAREIEHEVNEIAGQELLRWETYWGGAVTGFWGPGKPIKYRTPLFQRKDQPAAVPK